MSDILREECVAIWGEAGVAEMEAHCAANSMSLADFLEAVATAPGGPCDHFGVHVDSVGAPDLAMALRASHMLEHAETLRIALSGDTSAMFDPRRGV